MQEEKSGQLPCRLERYLPHSVKQEIRSDRSILLTSSYPLGDVVKNTGSWLHAWAKETPQNIFLAERSGEGWREVTYASALSQIQAIAASMLARGLNIDRPVVILSGNSINHAQASQDV